MLEEGRASASPPPGFLWTCTPTALLTGRVEGARACRPGAGVPKNLDGRGAVSQCRDSAAAYAMAGGEPAVGRLIAAENVGDGHAGAQIL
ncbi:hypothetical protein ACF09G_36570 [Streptomyces albogriseolus]|uniref:hypothetical protein n=1 Tax=Streptomyces albogriseolus TaxID=1887 RepID=UPI0019A65728|nr:hypothetical protein [Streptomyces sp.]